MAKKREERRLPESLNLPRTGVDSHAHLDSSPLWADLEGVLTRAAASGVARIGQIFLTHEVYARTAPLMSARAAAVPDAPDLFFILGVHPTDGLKVGEQEWALLAEDFRSDPRLRAVGEIGLDYHWPDCPQDVQYRVFRVQLRLALEMDLPVVIHCRDAFTDTLTILEEEGFTGRPLLWHCFGGDTPMAETILEHGWHISIPGPVTYSANQAMREAVRLIPADRLHLETDCPYLAPQPWRGKPNEPAYTVFTAEAVARERGMPTEELWTLCGHNTARFFGLEGADVFVPEKTCKDDVRGV